MNVLRSIYSVFFLSIVLSTSSLFGMMSSRSLISAVKKGDIKAAQQALDKGADVNAKDILSTTRKTALMLAVERNDVSMAKLLIQAGADLNARTWLGQTPLIIAAENGLIDMARLLLDSGAVLLKASDFAQSYSKGPTRRTALMHAVARNDIPMATLLLERGADPTIIMQANFEKAIFGIEVPTPTEASQKVAMIYKEQGISALSLAAAIGSEPMVTLLLGAGEFDPINMFTAQMIAVRKGNFKLARLLGKLGPRVADYMYIAAIAADDFDEVKRLLDEGAYVDASDNFGQPALLDAIRKGNPKMVALLFDHNATYRLGFLFQALVRGNLSVAKVIIDRGYGSLFERGLYKILSKVSGTKKDIALLMRYAVKKARRQPITPEETVQMRAAAKRSGVSIAVITTLIAALYTAKVIKTDTLHQAAADGSMHKVRMLIISGADIDRLDRAGMTPLMFAARGGYDQIVKVLLQHGANKNIVDRAGRSAYDYATRYPKIRNELLAPVVGTLLMGRKQALEQMESGETPDSPLGMLPPELLAKISREALEGPGMGERKRGVVEWMRLRGAQPMTPMAEAGRARRLQAIEAREREESPALQRAAEQKAVEEERLQADRQRLNELLQEEPMWELEQICERMCGLNRSINSLFDKTIENERLGKTLLASDIRKYVRVHEGIKELERQLEMRELDQRIKRRIDGDPLLPGMLRNLKSSMNALSDIWVKQYQSIGPWIERYKIPAGVAQGGRGAGIDE